MLFEQAAYVALQQKNRNEVFGFQNEMADFNQCYGNLHCSIDVFLLYFDRVLFCFCYTKKCKNNPDLFFYVFVTVLRPKASNKVSL